MSCWPGTGPAPSTSGPPRRSARLTTTTPVLHGGYHTDAQIQAGLAPTAGALLTAQSLRPLHHPAGGLLRGQQINDATCNWHPDVPVRLDAARADRDSVIANAWHCQAALRAHGAGVPVIDVGPSTTTTPWNWPCPNCWPGSST